MRHLHRSSRRQDDRRFDIREGNSIPRRITSYCRIIRNPESPYCIMCFLRNARCTFWETELVLQLRLYSRDNLGSVQVSQGLLRWRLNFEGGERCIIYEPRNCKEKLAQFARFPDAFLTPLVSLSLPRFTVEPAGLKTL